MDASQNPLGGVLKGQPLEVDIPAIEEELRELWKGAAQADSTDPESEGVVARASVLNLVVWTEDATQESSLTETISELTVQNPCRAIVVTAVAGEDNLKMEAWISAHCHRPSPASKVMCCEQISLRGSGGAGRELAATTIPFLISDLPVFVWWKGGRFFDSEFLKAISSVCDRLILDSKTFASPESDFAQLEEYIKAHHSRSAVSDVAWHRLMQWRELASQFFDPPVLRDHLEHIEHVTVEYNKRVVDGSGVPPQAYLLLGWLGSRLHWEVLGAEIGNEERRFHLCPKAGGHGITAVVRPADARLELSGHLVSFGLRTGEEWSTTFRIGKGEDPNCAQTEIAFANLPPFLRTVPLRIYNEVELIARQLEIFSHDQIYEESIQMAAALVRALKRP
ncbi:MAG: glucose-6-phosphate dehydrogenase assembly protein OpcA [Acidobacteriia bacterium]|nr:glucose-6-phosphate dehydrogenase assembly protein OpcA [Terriglobia bacterium]